MFPIRALVISAALVCAAAASLAQEAAPAKAAPPPQPAAAQPGRVLVEIYRIAPGQHEAFLRAIAHYDEVNVAAGLPPRQLYVHSDGASWDFMLIQPAEYPPGAAERVAEAAKRLGMPRGMRFFIEFRRYVAEHSDTFARGPTTAAEILAELD